MACSVIAARRAPLILAVFLLSVPALARDAAERLCDPVTNVCYCTGGWDGAECAAMRPLCEPGYWKACKGEVCSCTRRTWVYLAPGETPPPDPPLPEDRRAQP